MSKGDPDTRLGKYGTRLDQYVLHINHVSIGTVRVYQKKCR